MTGGGGTVDDHLARIRAHEKKLGIKTRVKRKPTAKGHPLAYLLDWYMLWRSSAQSGFGHQPATWAELRALDEQFDLQVDTFDAETLRRIDVLWLKTRPTKDDK